MAENKKISDFTEGSFETLKTQDDVFVPVAKTGVTNYKIKLSEFANSTPTPGTGSTITYDNIGTKITGDLTIYAPHPTQSGPINYNEIKIDDTYLDYTLVPKPPVTESGVLLLTKTDGVGGGMQWFGYPTTIQNGSAAFISPIKLRLYTPNRSNNHFIQFSYVHNNEQEDSYTTYGVIPPEAPTSNGTYVLKATVNNGEVTYSWVEE